MRAALLVCTALSSGWSFAAFAQESSPPQVSPTPAPQPPAPPEQTPPPAAQTPPASGTTPLPPVVVQPPAARPARPAVAARPARQRVATPPPPAAPPPPTLLPAVPAGQGPGRGVVATQSVTATKTDTPILETPQSISVVTEDQIRQQGVQTLTEALRYTPGLTTGLYGVNSLFDTIKVRGFEVPLFLDGLRLPVDAATTFATPRIVPYGLERIEVLRGPSSGLYGQTPPGGLVNMTSKRPTDVPQNEVGVQLGSFNRLQGTFDFSGPVDSQGEWLYRLVGLGRLSDTQLDFQQDNQYYIAPSFTWRNTNTRWTVLTSAQEYWGKGYQQYVPGIGSLNFNPNGRIPYNRYLGEPDQDYFKLKQQNAGWAFEHRFDDVLQFRQNLRFTNIDVELLAMRTEGIFPNLRTAPRSELFVFGNTKNFAVDNHFQADFALGPTTHKLLTGVDYYRTWSDSGFKYAPGTPIDVFDPMYGVPQVPVASMLTVLHSKGDLRQLGFYMQDQIRLDNWILMLTGRSDIANNTTNNLLTRTVTEQYDRAETGRAALSYVLPFGLAPYVVYSTSFQPTPGVDVAGRPFKPTTGKSQEVGIKYQPPGVNALITAAWYDTTQQNVLTTDPLNPFFSIQTGEINSKGFEFEAKASLSDRLDLIGSYASLSPRVTKSNAGNVGKYLANTALETAALWGMYTNREGLLAGWGFGAGVRYIGTSYADALNNIVIPSFTLYDAAVTYDFAYLRRDLRGLQMQVNVSNLTNKYYVANCFNLTYCSLGAARTVLLTLRYQWPQSGVKGQIADARDPRSKPPARQMW
ncbi:MAG: TonB-dependent siderophore receptor [Xanthobacteraceae bacterium]